VSVPGVYGGLVDKIPFGAIVNKALTVKSGQTHVQHYMKPLLARIEGGEIDPSFIITHRVGMHDVPDAYAMFRDKQHECVKVVIQPSA
jgi:threonine dehydrogenase-like Zn-dependent dehydrogenase